MFCNKCGTEVSFQYCHNCGVSQQMEVSGYKMTYTSPKFCEDCGSELKGAYCTSCGKSNCIPQVSAIKKLSSVWQMTEGIKRQAESSAKDNNDSETSNNNITSNLSSVSNQIMQYCLTAIFMLSLLGFIRYYGEFGLVFTNLLLLIIFLIGVIVTPRIVGKSKKNESYVYGATTLICLMIGIFALAKSYMSFLSFILILIPIVILGYNCIMYWKSFALPPALNMISDNIKGLRLSWMFCIFMYIGFPFSMKTFYKYIGVYSNISISIYIFNLIIILLFITGAYLIERKIDSKFKLAIGLLTGGCVLSLLRDISNFNLLSLLLDTAITVVVVYIGKNVFREIFDNYKNKETDILVTTKSNESSSASTNIHQSIPNSYAEKSKFSGGIGGIIGPKIAKFIMMIILIIIFVSTAASVDDVAASITIGIILLVINVICGAYFDMLIIKWEIVNTKALGKHLSFNATLASYIGLKIKVYLFTLITFGLYSTLGFAAVSVHRWKYRHSATPDSSQSDFVGRWYEYLGYIVVLIIGTVLAFFLTTSALVKSASNSISGFISFDSIFTFFNDPANFVGDFLSSIFDAGFIYLVVLFIFSIFIPALYLYIFTKWEISNAVVGNMQWTFNGKIIDAIGIVVLNNILTVVTLGLYAALGFAHLMVTKYKMNNIT